MPLPRWSILLPWPPHVRLRYGFDRGLGWWADLHGPGITANYDRTRPEYNADRPLASLLAWLVRSEVGFTEGDLHDALTWVSDFDGADVYEGLTLEVATLVGMLGRLREAASIFST